MFVLYHRATCVTGRAIAEALGVGKGTKGRRFQPGDTLIRWGAIQDVESGAVPGRVINSPDAIRLASDKLAAMRVMREAGIRVPDHDSLRSGLNGDYRVIGRTRRGYGGEGITVYTDCEQAAEYGHEMYVQYIENTREYRLHVVGNEVVRVQRKYRERGEGNADVKNHANGYVFKAPQRQLNQSRLDSATASVRALGLDFGAVDLVIDAEGREWVLEVNTAPGCSPKTLDAYTNALRRYCDGNA